MSDIFVVPPPEDQGKVDLSIFKELNQREGKVSWDERLELIRKQFPRAVNLDWGRVFKQDPTIAGRIVNDILKSEAAPAGRPGKRPAIDKHDAADRWRQILGEDHTSMPFNEAFNLLKGPRSIRQVAHRVNLDRNYVYKLLRDEAKPTANDMEQIAKAFNKHPSFFPEYRLAYVIGCLVYRLEANPDTTVTLFSKMQMLRNES